jgi:Ca2+-transporting ATPase
VAKASEDTACVYRGGEGLTITINSEELVVGDVIRIEAGAKIPTDCILLEGTDFATDESAMTGEPEQVEKHSINEANFATNP